VRVFAYTRAVSPSEPPPPPRSLRDALTLAREVLLSARRALTMLWATDAKLTAALAVMTVASGVLPAGLIFVAQRIIDGIVRAAESHRASDRAEVFRYMALEFGLVVASIAARRGFGVVESLLRVRFAQHVSEKILEKALTLGIEDFEDAKTFDRLSRARQGASYRPINMVQGMFGLGQEVLTLLAYGGLMAAVSGWMQLLIVVAAVPEFLVQTKFSNDAFRLFHWRSPETRRQSYYETVLTHANYAKEVRLFELGPLLLKRYKDFFSRFWVEDRNVTLRHGLWGLVLGLISNAAFYGAYVWVAFQAMMGMLTLGGVSLFVAVFRDAQSTVGAALHTVGSTYEDHLYLTTLFEFLDHVSVASTSGDAESGPLPEDGIRFESVSFAYPGAEKPVLSQLTLHLPRGHKLALVGENGAGKTTLIKLLTRLYRPTAGRITLDGRDLNEWNETALRRRIGVIFQDFVQYQFIVGENIGVGDVRSFEDATRWREAASRGMADTFIEELPKQYQTQLGKWFDDGQELSLGQWQKIALARAFMRRDADILVLDEPTASMDPAAEAQVFERFRALTDDRIAVVISHRFSTVRMADTIAVLANGSIIEQGTHNELIARGGRYAELFFLQARGYR
jgi:ATP-binding cassette, subfamily B, bacterial